MGQKIRRFVAVMLAATVAVTTGLFGAPTVGAAASSEWYAHFEQAGVAATIEAGTAAEIALLDTASQAGMQCVRLTTSEEGWPGPDKQCLRIAPASGASFDASGYNYLIFYIYDLQGANTLNCFLSDGAATSDGSWTNAATQGVWTRMVIDLRDAVYDAVDKSHVTEVILGEYAAGTFYIDSVFFANSADAPLPAAPNDMDNRLTRLYADCEAVYEAGQGAYSSASWNRFALVMEALSAGRETWGNLDGTTLGQYYDTLWNVYHSLTDEEEFPVGDVSGDGQVNSTDARLVLQYTVETVPLDGPARERADVNGDGKVNSADAREILQMTVTAG